MWGMIRKLGGIHKSNSLPLLNNGEKAELLAEILVRVHSINNISQEMKIYREHTVVLERTQKLWSKESLPLTPLMQNSLCILCELNRALRGAKQTSPGIDDTCYSMIKSLSEKSLEVILCLFNKIWNAGRLPPSWKHGVIVPIGKPGKDMVVVGVFFDIEKTYSMLL